MAEFLLLSLKGDGLGLALRLRQAGHKVGAWVRGNLEKDNYDGLIEKVSKWENFLTKDTIVIFDSTGGGRTADRLKQRGHHVWAGSTFADNLELDRELAFELMEQAGVKIPPFKTFYSWEEGKAYAKTQDRLVFKPTGKMSEDEALGSYVSSDPDDLITMLEFYEGVAKHKPEFILQKFVEGVCVSTEGWFNGEEFMSPFNHTIEEKSMMVDNLGPSSGCTFDIVWKIKGTNHIVEEGVKLMAPLLREYEFVGPMDLNTVVNDEGVWALEFTPRMGYDAFPTLLELFDEDPGEVIAKMARKEQPEEMKLKDGFASSLRISIPPHPSGEFTHPGGVPIQGLTRSDRPHLYFFEVRLNASDRLVSSKGGGAIAAITGYGSSIHDAFVSPYEIAKRMRVPEKQYRVDAVKTLDVEAARLNSQLAKHHNILKEVGGNAG